MHPHYLASAVSYKQRLLDVRVAKKKIPKELEFDAFAVKGVSGLAVSGLFGVRFKVDTCVVRKKGEIRNSTNDAETPLRVYQYLILDDLIETGETAYSIIHGMSLAHPEAKCVGAYAYNDGVFFNDSELREVLIEFKTSYPKVAERYKFKTQQIMLDFMLNY